MAAKPRRTTTKGPSIKVECASLLPEIIKAIEGVESDQGELRVAQMMASLVEKVGRIEKRVNDINFAHEEVSDPAEQQAILAGYASRLRQQRALVEEMTSLQVFQKVLALPAPEQQPQADGAVAAAASGGKAKASLVLRRGAEAQAGGPAKRQRK